MTSLELLKLRENLTIYEAHQYFIKSTVTNDESLSIDYIVNLINDGLLSLHLNPENFSMKIICSVTDDDCIEYICNECRLLGEQKITKAYLSRAKDSLITLNKETALLGDVLVDEVSEVIQRLAKLDDTPEHIKKDIEDTNKNAYKFLKRKKSILSKPLKVNINHYGLYVKRLEIEELLAASQPEQKPYKRRDEYKQPQREELILDQIIKLGYSPTKLPRRDSGKTGIKAKVRKLLDGQGVFEAPSAFNEAWKRLRAKERKGEKGGIAELK